VSTSQIVKILNILKVTMTMKIILKVETVLTNSCNWSVYSPCFSWNKIIKFAYFLLCEM